MKNLAVRDLAGPRATDSLIYNARHYATRDTVRVDTSRVSTVYPNGAVPFAAALQYFRRGVHNVQIGLQSQTVIDAHVMSPRRASEYDGSSRVTNVVWEYSTPEQASRLTTAFTSAIQDNVACGHGVIDALTWCLFEVMDNVFQHSRADSGFVMMQLHTRSKRCVIAVADTGIGVHKSFIESGTYPAKDAYEALKLAVQERVTSKAKNMGNGLYGLIRVVGLNGGELEIRSGRGWLRFSDFQLDGGSSVSTPLLDAENNQGTTVDWQLDMGKAVTLNDALDTPRPVPSRLEHYEDDWGRHVLRVKDFEEEIGSRTAASAIRTRLGNIVADVSGPVFLDFAGIAVVSSSFADEVIGKFVLEFGQAYFDERIKLMNMNSTVSGIVGRAILQRVQEGDENFPARSAP